MADLTDQQIERAGRMVKVLRLAADPGMDSVAIRLNSGLTYDELKSATMWAKAFDLARDDSCTVFDGAAMLRECLR